jgi:hypothetical protein
MGRISFITAAILLLTASWVCAGNFEVLAGAGVIRPAAPLNIQPGTLVKAEFKSNMRTTSDVELDADFGIPQEVAAPTPPQVQPRPAAAVKERRNRGMAPPPRLTAPRPDPNHGRVAAGRDEDIDLEADLEKDLVISPPPARTDDQIEMQTKPMEKKPAAEKKSVTDKKSEKKAAPAVKKMAPAESPSYSISQKPIQKVRTTQNAWDRPAGAHVKRSCPPGQSCVAEPPRGAETRYQPMMPPYMASAPRTTVAPGGRIVRDGVTIKLAPAAACPSSMDAPEDAASSDILSTAVEILGMPFAFISSFF